jgi:hypothetical protein
MCELKTKNLLERRIHCVDSSSGHSAYVGQVTQRCGFGPHRRCHPTPPGPTGHGSQPLPRSLFSQSIFKKKIKTSPAALLSSVLSLPPLSRHSLAATNFSYRPAAPTGSLSHFCCCHAEPDLKQIREGRVAGGRRSPMLGRSTEAADQHKSEPHMMRK